MKPCPFCGNDKIKLSSYFQRDPDLFWMSCDKCRARGSYSRTKQGAVIGWNTRIDESNAALQPRGHESDKDE